MIFVIHAPVPYTHRSGGVRALYRLAHELNVRGFETGVSSIGSPRRHDHSTCQQPNADHWSSDKLDEAIHIYPEIVATNKIKERRIVRWLLNSEQHRPRKDELQFVWTPSLKPDRQRLTVNIIELDVFHPKEQPGDKVLWYGGKGARLARGIPAGAVQITHSWPETRAQMADELRNAKQLISFDGFSAINLEASLCGTPTLIPAITGSQRPVDPLFLLPGVAFGEDEWDWAQSTVDEASESYLAAVRQMDTLIDGFVQSCQEQFLSVR